MEEVFTFKLFLFTQVEKQVYTFKSYRLYFYVQLRFGNIDATFVAQITSWLMM